MAQKHWEKNHFVIKSRRKKICMNRRKTAGTRTEQKEEKRKKQLLGLVRSKNKTIYAADRCDSWGAAHL